MDYVTRARTLAVELQELRKKAPDWWHANQVRNALETLEASICVAELEPPSKSQAAPTQPPSAEAAPLPVEVDVVAAPPELLEPKPEPTPEPLKAEDVAPSEEGFAEPEPTVVYDDAVPAQWSE